MDPAIGNYWLRPGLRWPMKRRLRFFFSSFPIPRAAAKEEDDAEVLRRSDADDAVQEKCEVQVQDAVIID